MAKSLYGEDNRPRLRPASRHDALRATRSLYEAMHRFDGAVADALGIHRTELRWLNALEQGPLKPTEIGARLGLTSGAVTALVERLAKARLVHRRPDAADRRSNAVALTPQARPRVDAAYGVLGSAIAARLRSHTAAERERMGRALAALAEGFDVATTQAAALASTPRRRRSAEGGSARRKPAP
jgi:DNA-binding MarR family transcriptional regulator